MEVILTEAFFDNIPYNSYIQIFKPKKDQGMFHISILTTDKMRIRATSCGTNLQGCVDEISTADMTLDALRPQEKIIEVEINQEKIDEFIRKMWKQVNE